MRQQFDLLTKLSSELTEGSRALRQARSVKEQLEALEVQAKGATATAVRGLEKDVAELLEPQTPAPKASVAWGLRDAVGRIQGLYDSVGQSDAAPTEAQSRAAAALSQSLPALLRQWQAIADRQVTALNRRLKEAHLPPLDPGAPPSHEEEGADRDEG